MNQPVFYTTNTNRKAKFALTTKVWNLNGKLQVEKRASSVAALPHLEAILTTYGYLSSLSELQGLTKIVRAVKKKESIWFSFVEGPSVERELIKAVLDDDATKVKILLNRAIKIVEALPGIDVKPTDNARYETIFSDAYSEKVSCAQMGIIDLNLDNFIIDSAGKWHMIDYEWVFDFPVPKRLLIQRLLWWFIVRHQESFKYSSRKVSCLALADNIYVPKIIYLEYYDYLADLNSLLRSELAFQRFVTGGAHREKDSLNFYEKAIDNIEPQIMGIDRILLHENRATRLMKENHVLRVKVSHLENTLFKKGIKKLRTGRNWFQNIRSKS